MDRKEPTLIGLLEDLKSFNKSGNIRNKLLALQLYAEHYVNAIVLEQVSKHAKEEVKTYLTFPQKLRILKKMDVVDERTERILGTLNSIRDLLVHNLMVYGEDIEKRLEGVNLGFKYTIRFKPEKGPEKIKVIDLEEHYKGKITKYAQLDTSCVLIIGILYSNLMALKGEKQEEGIDVEFKEDENKGLIVTLLVHGKKG